MKVSPLALLGLFVFVDTNTLLRAEESEKRTWRLEVEKDHVRLDYGTDNVEDIPIAVKAGRSMTASLTAGRTTSKVRGKTSRNEEAGTPSFEGTQPANDRLFAALSKERNLVFVVGPSRDQVPLRDIGDKADRLSRLCQKR